MGLLYGTCLGLARGVFFCTLRTTVDSRQLIQRDGAFVLAVTHLSHLEPLFASAPIVPCVMLGTDKLNKVKPWLPFRRAHIWVAFGNPIYPPAGCRSTRATRAELATQISAAFGEIYAGLRQRHQICDSTVP